MMSPSFREMQPESTTGRLCKDIMDCDIADESAWRCMLVSGDQAYICPHRIDPEAEYSPNVYGLELIDGNWFLSGEIVNERLGSKDE